MPSILLCVEDDVEGYMELNDRLNEWRREQAYTLLLVRSSEGQQFLQATSAELYACFSSAVSAQPMCMLFKSFYTGAAAFFVPSSSDAEARLRSWAEEPLVLQSIAVPAAGECRPLFNGYGDIINPLTF